MIIRILGSGGSIGVPRLFCSCAVCSSTSNLNKRTRASVLIELNGLNFLIDCGPDLRNQLIRESITHIDAILLTHAHFDHIAGILDLRPQYEKTNENIPCVLSKESLNYINTEYSYISRCIFLKKIGIFFIPCDRLPSQISLKEIELSCFDYPHSGCRVTGYRINDFAYVTDISEWENHLYEELSGVKNLIIGAGRWEKNENQAHLSVNEIIKINEKLKIDNIFLTHLSHELNAEHIHLLPKGISFAYDGMILED